MKKSFLVVFSILMLSSLPDIYAQSCCPSSLYSQVTIGRFINPASGCEFSITYCYYNGPGGDRKVYLCNIEIPIPQTNPPCNFNNFVLNETFWDLVLDKILHDLDNDIEFDPCGEGGGQTNLIVEYSKAKCMKIIIDQLNNTYYVVACNEEPGLCITEFTVCKENGELITTIVAGPTPTGSGECGNTPPDIGHSDPECFQSCQ